MCIVGAIIGAAVIGGVASTVSADKAAGAQKDAANQANLTQSQQYGQTRADQAPWRAAGGDAVRALSSYYGLPGADGKTPDPATTAANDNKLIQSLPGYQFNVDQGNEAVQRNLAAKGLLDSGAAQKALTQYGQGMATSASGQYLNGLQSLAGLGQTATANTGVAGANAANQIGANQIYAGNATASGYANTANAINSGLGNAVGAYGQYNAYQNAMYGPAYSGPTTGYAAAGGTDAGFNSFLNDIYSPSYSP